MCRLRTGVLWLGALLSAVAASAQDDRANYPAWLTHAFVEFDVGDIRYPFSARQLEDGYSVESVDTPRLAARLTLGRQVNDRTSVELTYLRPARWVVYRGLNGPGASRSLWMNVIGASMRQRVRLSRATIFGEAGLAMVTRHGIEIDGSTVVSDVVYPTPLLGAGVEYRLADAWGVHVTANFLPGRSSVRQPYTSLVSGGVVYRVVPPAQAAAREPNGAAAVFHEHLIQGGLTSAAFGTSLNRLMSPLFWEGEVKVGTGFSIDYQQNLFHTAKLFSLDWGASVEYRSSLKRSQDFMTLSVYPVLRLTPIRTSEADFYFHYSLAGPAFISRPVIDGIETGGRFTMRDSAGFGVYLGARKHLNAEVKISHLSNGNLLPRNSGVQVPVTLTLGWAF